MSFKIVLEENDSFIQPDGEATMIVVAVHKEDGKIVRFPYSSQKSMSALISDVNLKIGEAPVSEARPTSISPMTISDKRPTTITPSVITPRGIIPPLIPIEGQIGKEDLVRCVKLLPRVDKYAPIDMVIGGIYRVLTLPTAKIPYYEVIDDTDYHKGDIPRRTPAYPEEIIFFEKRKAPIPKEIGRLEEIFNCELCQSPFSSNKADDEKYHGSCQNIKCESFGKEIVHDTVRNPVKESLDV